MIAPAATRIDALAFVISSAATATPVTATISGNPVVEYSAIYTCSDVSNPAERSNRVATNTGTPRTRISNTRKAASTPGAPTTAPTSIAIPDVTKNIGIKNP